MAVKVGQKVTYHSEHGPWTGWVTDYQAGRDGGDYTVKGFTNEAASDAGEGDTFSRHAVVGDEQGAFTTHA